MAPAAYAEAPRFTAEVEREQVSTGEPFVYQVTLSIGRDEVSDYQPPDFKGLRVLDTPSAPNQSTQMSFGGAGMFVQTNYSWRYELAALRPGRLTIGAARVRVNGKDYRSNPVTITATGSVANTSPPPVDSPPAANAGPAPNSGAGIPSDALPGSSFLRAVTDKTTAFVGEAIAATWYLYMGQSADKYDTLSEPRTEGFWSEDIAVPSRRGGLVLTQESVQGRPYQVGTVLKKALFPLQPGKATITPMEAEISRSDFFGNAVRSQRLRSVATTIEVLPLPKAGQPPGFDSANVGSFTLNVRADRTQVSVGEAVTLTVEVSGRGNLRKLALPTLPKMAGWKVYDPRVKVVIDPATGVTGTKTAEILLLPERSGTFSVPALALDTFDPEGRRYVHLQSATIGLTVAGDATAVSNAASAAPGAGAAARATESSTFRENLIGEEIRPLRVKGNLRRELGTTFFRTNAFVVTLLLPPLGLLAAMLALRIRDRMDQDSDGTRRRRRARKKVRAHLSAAERHRQSGEVAPFFIEIDRVLRETLSARLGRSVKGLRRDELADLLQARGLLSGEVERVIALFDECDRGRFAPADSSPALAQEMAKVQDGASELIDAIERARFTEEPSA